VLGIFHYKCECNGKWAYCVTVGLQRHTEAPAADTLMDNSALLLQHPCLQYDASPAPLAYSARQHMIWLEVHRLSADNRHRPIIGQSADNRYRPFDNRHRPIIDIGWLFVLVSKTTKNAFNCSSHWWQCFSVVRRQDSGTVRAIGREIQEWAGPGRN